MPSAPCRAILFDLDGVLVDSRECVELVWRAWAAAQGLDAAPFLAVAHGRRISDTLRLVAPALDAAAEAAVMDRMEETETRGLRVAPGAAELVAALGPGRWAVVTSGSRAVATLRLRTAELPIPAVFVTADDVGRGKPDPEPYLTATARLGVSPADCLVCEDSPTGLAAALAAGIRTIALLTTHRAEALAGADATVASLAALALSPGTGGSVSVGWP
jgi:mannitol-1-/sugar-/sorbitol-6-phosphatase